MCTWAWWVYCHKSLKPCIYGWYNYIILCLKYHAVEQKHRFYTQSLVLTTVVGLCPCNYSVYSPLQRSNCSVVDNTTITCSTPNLTTTSLTPLDYALMFDDVPSTTQVRLPISVQSDPSNFRLASSQEVTSGTDTLIRIVVRPIYI